MLMSLIQQPILPFFKACNRDLDMFLERKPVYGKVKTAGLY